MDSNTILANIRELAERFARDRAARQLRRALDPADFDALRDAGFLRTGVPREIGGVWESVERTTQPVCQMLRTLARGTPGLGIAGRQISKANRQVLIEELRRHRPQR